MAEAVAVVVVAARVVVVVVVVVVARRVRRRVRRHQLEHVQPQREIERTHCCSSFLIAELVHNSFWNSSHTYEWKERNSITNDWWRQ